jgi:hypothetical protein
MVLVVWKLLLIVVGFCKLAETVEMVEKDLLKGSRLRVERLMVRTEGADDKERQ